MRITRKLRNSFEPSSTSVERLACSWCQSENLSIGQAN